MFGALKSVFPKCVFFGPQLYELVLEWYLLNSSKALAPHGCPLEARALSGLKKYS